MTQKINITPDMIVEYVKRRHAQTKTDVSIAQIADGLGVSETKIRNSFDWVNHYGLEVKRRRGSLFPYYKTKGYRPKGVK